MPIFQKIFFDTKAQESIQMFFLSSQHWTIFYLHRTGIYETDNCEVMGSYTPVSHISCVHDDWSNFYSVPLASSVILNWGSEIGRQVGGC